MAKEFEILEQASEIAEQAWERWKEVRSMGYTVERPVSVEQAIQVVASHPHIGQVEQGIYIGKQLASNGVDRVVDLIAVWDGAAKLAQDPTVRCVVLERNPNLWGLEDATSLTIDREGERIRLVYRKGEVPLLDIGRARLVNTILGNIIRGLV